MYRHNVNIELKLILEEIQEIEHTLQNSKKTKGDKVCRKSFIILRGIGQRFVLQNIIFSPKREVEACVNV